jgi:hypothetical protein
MSAQVDIGLDPDTGDLPALPALITGIALIEQRIKRRLRTGLGEWFLDPAGVGLPLLVWRQQKPPDLTVIVQRVQQEIRDIPGVSRTENFVGVHDPAARRVTVSGDVFAADGSVTSAIVTATSDAARNAWFFSIFFSRASGVGPIVRSGLRGP